MKTKHWLFILSGLILIAAGFFTGRWTIKQPEPKIEYVKGETVHDTVPGTQINPYHSEIPDKPDLPLTPDTVRLPGKPEYITQKVDTAKIIAEFITKNSYSNTLFDNDNGKIIVGTTVQYNKLKAISYEFTPIQKIITKPQKETVLTPFINISWNSFGYYGAGGGVYYHDVGVGAKYITNFNNKGYELSLNYKF